MGFETRTRTTKPDYSQHEYLFKKIGELDPLADITEDDLLTSWRKLYPFVRFLEPEEVDRIDERVTRLEPRLTEAIEETQAYNESVLLLIKSSRLFVEKDTHGITDEDKDYLILFVQSETQRQVTIKTNIDGNVEVVTQDDIPYRTVQLEHLIAIMQSGFTPTGDPSQLSAFLSSNLTALWNYRINLAPAMDSYKKRILVRIEHPLMIESQIAFGNCCEAVLNSTNKEELTASLERVAGFLADIKASPFIRGSLANFKPDTICNELFSHLEFAFRSINQSRHSKLSPKFNKIIVDFYEAHEADLYPIERFRHRKLEHKIGGWDQNTAHDYETFWTDLLGLSSQEITTKRQRNWGQVHDYIVDTITPRGGLQTSDLERVNQISLRGIVPQEYCGFRQEGEETRAGLMPGVPSGRVTEEIDELVTKANQLLLRNPNRNRFFIEAGKLFADYAAIHPHRDGNGTTAIFFIEAMASLYGEECPNTFSFNPKERISNALRGNKLAFAAAATVRARTLLGIPYKSEKYKAAFKE